MLLEEQSDRFECTLLLSPCRYDYLLKGGKKDLLAYNQVLAESDTEKKFSTGFLLEHLNGDKITKLDEVQETIFHSFPYFSLVPSKLFDKDQCNHYLGTDEVHSFYENFRVKNEELVLVHALPKRLYGGLTKKHKKVAYKHVISAIFRELSNGSEEEVCSIFIVDKIMYVAVVKSGRFLGVNYYEYHHLNDLLYYVALNFSNYKLDKTNTPLHLHGYLEKQSGVVQTLKTYFNRVELDTPNKEYEEKTGKDLLARLFQFIG